MRRIEGYGRLSILSSIALGILILAITSCKSTDDVTPTQQTRLDRGWPKGNHRWQPAVYEELRTAIPVVEGAEYLNEDDICMLCHQTYVEAFANNVHRQNKCESCHGPASRHLETRGKEPGLIRSFKTMQPAERSEICARCHEEDSCAPGANWRTSAHAHNRVACTDCHRNHYNVPKGTPATTLGDDLARLERRPNTLVSYQTPADALPSLRGTSNNLGAVAPQVCYKCHSERRELEEVAHPHQIGGPNGLDCMTCHDPHGNVVEWSRKSLCLQCHNDSPVAAWHSSIHDQAGVSCTDCHNPHPNTNVPLVVNIGHTSVERPKRLPMSVSEPDTCYKCHSKILAQGSLPSHHPIKEGKMTCTACHDPHGQTEGNLKAESVNMVCYRCHAEKQGPFVYEHPPVTENCTYCHDPHGTVANNLLRQPPVFLCLRCHAGHRAPPSDHFGIATSDIDGNPSLRPAFYTNCTQCHSQIHGSDLPSQHRAGALLR